MSASILSITPVEKPWGQNSPDLLPTCSVNPIGEIWFDDTGHRHLPLLIKYLFTNDRLSIQVHPNDEQAQACGYSNGKDEAWFILDAQPNAKIGLGLTQPLTESELRVAALNGSIASLLDWQPVEQGQAIFVPAGTIHAIGADIILVEVQQNIDLTYRLYDYGSDRELHLDDAIAAANIQPYHNSAKKMCVDDGRDQLMCSEKFSIEKWSWSDGKILSLSAEQFGWFIPLSGTGTIDGKAWNSGQCWLMTGQCNIVADKDSTALFAFDGDRIPMVR